MALKTKQYGTDYSLPTLTQVEWTPAPVPPVKSVRASIHNGWVMQWLQKRVAQLESALALALPLSVAPARGRFETYKRGRGEVHYREYRLRPNPSSRKSREPQT